jgi:hypothetical protein
VGVDSITGGDGPDKITGGPAKDSARGGPGNDRLNMRDGTRDNAIDCGPGRQDLAQVDREDGRAKNCEIVRRG